MKKRVLLWAISLSATALHAQERFTLQAAQDYAMEHAYGVQIAELEIARAKQIFRQNLAVGLPQASAGGQYAYNLELGGFVADMNGDGVLETLVFGTDYQAQGNLTVSQLVFNGSYIVGLMAAEVLKEGAELGLKKSKAELKRDVAKAYNLALLSEASVDVLAKNETLLKDLTQELKRLNEVGFISKADADQMELNYNTVKNALVYAQGQAKVAKMLLKVRMGFPVDAPVQLMDGLDDLTTKAFADSYLTTTSFDAAQTLDYMQLANQVRGAELQVKNRYMEFLPTLGVSYQNNVQYMSPEANIFGSSAVEVPSSLVGASINVPLWSSGRGTAALQEAKIQRDQAKIGLEQLEQGLQMQYASLQVEYHQSVLNYLAEKENVELAQRIRDQRQKEFTAGVGSSSDLTQSETQYQQSLQRMFAAAQKALDQQAELIYLFSK